jgi:hypothetical protein
LSEPNIIKSFPKDYQPRDFNLGSLLDPEELKMYYLFGIDMSGPDGTPFPEELYMHYLEASMEEMEGMLNIQIRPKTFIDEQHDYFASDYTNWGFLQLWKRPVSKVSSLKLSYGNAQGFTIPTEWIKLDKRMGQINLFPTAGTAGGLIIGNNGLMIGLSSYWQYAPMAWKVSYEAGFDVIPSDLKNVIYEKATIGVMSVWGDLIIGAGIASQSIGLDGLSQSVSTTQSAMFSGASGRIEQYRKDLQLQIPMLQKKYGNSLMVIV